MRQPEGTTLLEQAQWRILDGVFLPACESQNVPKMSVKEPKEKTPAGKNRSACGKTVMEKSGKSKATESSQG